MGHIQGPVSPAADRERPRSNLHSGCLQFIACGEPVSSRGHGSQGPAELPKHLPFCSSQTREARTSSLLVIMVNSLLSTGWEGEVRRRRLGL